MSNFIKKALLLLCISTLLIAFSTNAQFVVAKKKQKTVRHGQWELSGAQKGLEPLTVILNDNFNDYEYWQEKMGEIIQDPAPSDIEDAYNILFKKASTGNPDLSDKSGALKRALDNRAYGYYAKLCAFVYYADMDTITTGNTWHKLSENNKRNHFRDRAIEFMKKIDYRGHINGFEKLQYSSKGLLMALQAYDLLKASGNVEQSDLDNMKYSLQWWAKDVYTEKQIILVAFGRIKTITVS